MTDTPTTPGIAALPAALRELLLQAQRERLDRQAREREEAAQAPARAAQHWEALVSAAEEDLPAILQPYTPAAQPAVWTDGIRLYRLEILLPGLAPIGVVYSINGRKVWTREPGWHVSRAGLDTVYAELRDALLSAYDAMTEETIDF